MTTPIPQYLDPNNPLLATGPARLDVGSIELPGVGKLAVITVRTTSATQTVMLGAEDLKEWSDLIAGQLAEMTGAKIKPATAQEVAVLDQAMPFRKR